MFEIYDVVIVPFILGLVELFKRAGVNKKVLPFIAVIIGIVIGIVYVAEFNLKQGILIGAMLGLSASGLYSGAKNTVEKTDD